MPDLNRRVTGSGKNHENRKVTMNPHDIKSDKESSRHKDLPDSLGGVVNGDNGGVKVDSGPNSILKNTKIKLK